MVACGSSPVTRFALASTMRKTKRLRRLTWRSSIHHSKMHLSAIMVWILEYFFFAKFTVLTWFANHSVIRLRKVAFLGAKKPLVFRHHLNAVFLRSAYQEYQTIALWRHLCRMTHSAQTMFGFSSTWKRSCRKTLLTFTHIRLCHVYSKRFSRTNWEMHWNRFVHTADSFVVFSVNKSTAFTGPLDANRPAAEN